LSLPFLSDPLSCMGETLKYNIWYVKQKNKRPGVLTPKPF